MSTDRTNNNTTTRCCHDKPFFRRLTSVLVSIFVIIMVIISIAWLAMHPHPSFGVTSLSVTNFTVSDSQVRGRYEVGLTITNPNKIKTEVVLYRVAELRLHGEEWNSVAAVQQQPVFLEKKSNESVKFDLEVKDLHKKVKVVPESLVKEWNKGVVNFNVVLSVKVRFEAGIWPSMDKLLDVWCMDLDVGFLSPTKDAGKLLGVGKDCHTQ